MCEDSEDSEFLILDPSANVLEELTNLLTFYKSQKTILETIFATYGCKVFESSNFKKIVSVPDKEMLEEVALRLTEDTEIACLEDNALAKIGLLSKQLLEVMKEKDEQKDNINQLNEVIGHKREEVANMREENKTLKRELEVERQKVEEKNNKILELTQEMMKPKPEPQDSSKDELLALINDMKKDLLEAKAKPSACSRCQNFATESDYTQPPVMPPSRAHYCATQSSNPPPYVDPFRRSQLAPLHHPGDSSGNFHQPPSQRYGHHFTPGHSWFQIKANTQNTMPAPPPPLPASACYDANSDSLAKEKLITSQPPSRPNFCIDDEKLKCPICSSTFPNKILMEKHFEWCGRE